MILPSALLATAGAAFAATNPPPSSLTSFGGGALLQFGPTGQAVTSREHRHRRDHLRAAPGHPRRSRAGPALVDLIQTGAAVSPGNSGGALVNADGDVVGINVAYLPPQAGSVSIGFAIPAGTVVDVVDQLLEQGRVRHPFLGIQPAALTSLLADRLGVERQRGVLVLAVERASRPTRPASGRATSSSPSTTRISTPSRTSSAASEAAHRGSASG